MLYSVHVPCMVFHITLSEFVLCDKTHGTGQQGETVDVKAREVPVIVNIRKRAHNFKNVLFFKKKASFCLYCGGIDFL
jgi:hypothetical protein